MIFIILIIMAICYLQQRLRGVIKTQKLISKFDLIGHVSNIHASLRNDILKALFILIEQNKIIVVIMVLITYGNTDIIKVTLFIVQ